MEITQCKYPIKCELGACGKRAVFTIQPSKTGVKSAIHICQDCLREIVTIGSKLSSVANKAKSGINKAEKDEEQKTV